MSRLSCLGPTWHRASLSGLLVLGLLGCSSDAPRLDARWGQSLSQAQALQTAYPGRSGLPRGPIETDAVVTGLGIARYHQSFETPPASSQGMSQAMPQGMGDLGGLSGR